MEEKNGSEVWVFLIQIFSHICFSNYVQKIQFSDTLIFPISQSYLLNFKYTEKGNTISHYQLIPCNSFVGKWEKKKIQKNWVNIGT